MADGHHAAPGGPAGIDCLPRSSSFSRSTRQISTERSTAPARWWPKRWADKVDAALYDATTERLVAAGTSHTPMGRKQHAIGMNRLPVANGGREVDVFLTGVPYATGQADQDPGQLRGMTEGLGIRSAIMVPLEVAGTRRGVFLASSARPDFFAEDDVRFLEAVSRWVGMIAHRAELTERIAAEAREQGRRVAADELIATLAHDLGNFLVPIKGRIDLLRRRARREDRTRDLRDVEEAARAVDRVVSLVADLLDSSRLEQGLFALNRQPVDFADLVRETCAALATNTVPIRVDVPVRSRPRRGPQPDPAGTGERALQCHQVLSRGSRGRRRARRRVSRRGVLGGGDRDRPGAGYSARALPAPLRSLRSWPGSSGLGIGLYLASRIVAAHGGTLTADPTRPSEPDSR